jgi:Cu-Zn family superoxide dismutase
VNSGKSAISTLTSDLVNGYVFFHQCIPSNPVRVEFMISGPKNKTHAIHIHEYGDLTRGCESLGSHFNPTRQTHGSIYVNNMPRHSGDLINNITFNNEGKFYFVYEDSTISLYPTSNLSIIGRSIVIHEKQDDLGMGVGLNKQESLKTGNAGKRICCGVIGIAENKNHL